MPRLVSPHVLALLAVVALAAMPAATDAQVHGAAPPPPRPAPPARPAAPLRPVVAPRPLLPARPVLIPAAGSVGHPLVIGTRPSVVHEAFPSETKLKSPRMEYVQSAQPMVLNVVPPANYKRASFIGNVHNGPYWNRPVGPQFYNPHHWHNWSWNNYVVWYPVPTYWGGGFWGGYPLAGLATASPLGYYLDDQDREYFPSYESDDGSAGNELLQNYGLQQTACGQPDLVVIWGPRNSVICAIPNDLVPAGNYRVDPGTLTLQAAY